MLLSPASVISRSTCGTGHCCSFGFAGALRRSELVGLDVSDITEDDDGLRIVLRRSKTDQEGETKTLGLPYGFNPATCPVRAWRAWRDAAALETGPAFRAITRHGRIATIRLSDRAIANMIRRRALAAGLDSRFAGHSLRAGFATRATHRAHPNSPSCATVRRCPHLLVPRGTCSSPMPPFPSVDLVRSMTATGVPCGLTRPVKFRYLGGMRGMRVDTRSHAGGCSAASGEGHRCPAPEGGSGARCSAPDRSRGHRSHSTKACF
jgi:hypothetical protein